MRGLATLAAMDADKKKSLAAISSVVWSALLTLMKFIVGLITGSLGMLSEALHSGLDLLAALGTLFAVRIAARPADDDHPYGHGKIENLTALGETLLLLATAAWVITEAIERLLNPESLHVETSVWAFVVIIVSLVVDINRSAMLRRVAKETKSAALEADAAHFATDIWSSFAVLLGITGAAIAGMTVQDSWLHWLLMRADVFASLIVALLILHVCKELGMQAINNLMDKADGETAGKIRELMKERMPAYPLISLRVREVGNRAYADMCVGAPRELHVDTAHEIADAIEALLSGAIPGVETMVHIQPMELEDLTPNMLVRQIALAHRFGVHGLVLHDTPEGLIVFTDLELPGDAVMGAWSVPIQAFRSEVRRRLNAARVVVHVEPDVRELKHYSEPLPPEAEWKDRVRKAMIELSAPLPDAIDTYCRGDQRLCIVSIPAENALNVSESHLRLKQLEDKLSRLLPNTARFIVAYS